jgi:hypothetical protein
MALKIHLVAVALVALILTQIASADDAPKTISGPFGSKPIQLSVSSDGIKQRKEGGYICDLNASLGGGHYSEWGETEDDARTIVTKTCSNKSGLLLCKKDKATCRQDK